MHKKQSKSRNKISSIAVSVNFLMTQYANTHHLRFRSDESEDDLRSYLVICENLHEVAAQDDFSFNQPTNQPTYQPIIILFSHSFICTNNTRDILIRFYT